MEKCGKWVLPFYFRAIIFVAFFLLKLSFVSAQSVDISGQFALELRGFPDKPLFADQFNGAQFSTFLEPEFRWRSEDRNSVIKLTPFARIDAVDNKRTHFDIREAYFRKVTGDWEFLLGATRVFWGVTESRHLVNVINQIDAVEEIDEEDFLGQPMLQIGRQSDYGRFDLFIMTGFRERTFPDKDGRLRTPLPVKTSAAQYKNSGGKWRPDVALRYSHYLGDFDIGLHVFHGINREPSFSLSPNGQRLIPRYAVMTQAGIDLQYTHGAWLWKFEGIVREGQGRTFAAIVAGLEYTFFQIAETDIDLGLIVEGLYDGRDKLKFSNVFSEQITPTIYDRDIFLGSRLAFNDVQDTSLLLGFVTDVIDGPATLRIEAERRIGDSFKAEFIAQVFFEDNLKNPVTFFKQDNFLTLRLSKFF